VDDYRAVFDLFFFSIVSLCAYVHAHSQHCKQHKSGRRRRTPCSNWLRMLGQVAPAGVPLAVSPAGAGLRRITPYQLSIAGGARGGEPAARPQARPNQEPESKPEPDRARVPESESTEESDRVRTQESESTGESDRVWTQEPESTKSPIFFLPRSPSPRKSPISLDLRARLDSRVRIQKNRTLCASLVSAGPVEMHCSQLLSPWPKPSWG
jgi:hypothetical protein